MVVIFAFFNPCNYFPSAYCIKLLGFFHSVILWSAFFTFYTQSNLVQGDFKSCVSLISPHFVSFASLVKRCLKYHALLIHFAFSINFFIATGLAQHYFKALYYFKLPFTFLLSQVWHSGISQDVTLSQASLCFFIFMSNNIYGFLCLSTMGSLT